MKGIKKWSFKRLLLIIVLLLLTISLTQNAVGEQIDVTSHDPLPFNSHITVTFRCDFYGNNCEGGAFSRYLDVPGYIHSGLDLDNPSDGELFENRVAATLAGKVTRTRSNVSCSGTGCPGAGNYVGIEHLLVDGSKIFSHYGHLVHMEGDLQAAGLNANDDDYVVSGSFLGYKGTTGFSFGTHLHFEISNQDHFSSIEECAPHWIPGCENNIRNQPVATLLKTQPHLEIAIKVFFFLFYPDFLKM
jgi:murein DD-endopeptidase MepM/ murein hydrolase activator NlpD